MDRYVYTLSAGNIKPFMDKLQGTGVPPKLTLVELASMGFKGSNDRALIPVLKAMGFISSKGDPLERWTQYRNKSASRRILGEAIQEYYADLFRMYSDAQRQDNEALTNFFTSKTKLGERAVGAMVQTFKALVELADFDSPDTTIPPSPPTDAGPDPGRVTVRTQASNRGTVVNVNIQLTLPDTTNFETYEAIFKALKKHVLE